MKRTGSRNNWKKEKNNTFLDTQVELLLNYILAHKTLIFGKCSGATAKFKMRKDVTTKINVTSSIKRPNKEVQKRFWGLKL